MALPAWCACSLLIDVYYWRWGHALFSLINGVFLVYAVTRFVGWRDSLVDLGVVDERTERPATVRAPDAAVVSFRTQRPRQQPALAAAPVFASSPVQQAQLAEARVNVPEH